MSKVFAICWRWYDEATVWATQGGRTWTTVEQAAVAAQLDQAKPWARWMEHGVCQVGAEGHAWVVWACDEASVGMADGVPVQWVPNEKKSVNKSPAAPPPAPTPEEP